MLSGAGLAWAQSSADQDRTLAYTVAPRDSVIAISIRLLENPSDWPKVAAENQLNARALLRPGQVLQIPRELLKSVPADALVESVSGDARANREPAVVGQKLTENSVIETQADGVVQLRLADGSILRVAPSSRLRIERLRRYHRDDVIEARTVLEQGRVEAQAAPNRTKPLEIRTPFATAAVRGTDFRVSAQAQASPSEVLTGTVSWGKSPGASRPAAAATAADVSVPGGYGAAGTAKGVTQPEALLPAPDLGLIAASSTNALVRAEFAVVAGAVAYRVAVSMDDKFDSVLAETLIQRAELSFESRSDGAHYFRVRPVSPTSVEGFDKIARVDIRARPFAPRIQAPENNGISFSATVQARWNAAAQASGYRVQLAADAQFTQILNEQTVAETAAVLALQPSTQRRTVRHWRVAGINAAGGYLGPFSSPVELRFYAVPKPPRVVRAVLGDVLLGWEAAGAERSERYLLQLADSSDFARPQQFAPDSPRQTLNTLAPGRYYVRLAAVADDGVTTPYSDPIELRVRDTVRSSGGSTIESGSGAPVEVPSY